MNIATLEDDIHNWLAVLLPSTQLCWNNEDAERPLPYVGMYHTAMVPLGLFGSKSAPGEADVATITRNTEFTLMLVGYDSDYLKIYTLFDLLQLPQTRSSLTSQTTHRLVYLGDEGGVRDTSTKVGNHTEKRASLDLRLRFGNVVSYTSEIIETINLTLEAKKAQATVLSKTITVEE